MEEEETKEEGDEGEGEEEEDGEEVEKEVVCLGTHTGFISSSIIINFPIFPDKNSSAI